MINGPGASAEGRTWYRFTNADSSPECTDLYIYDEIGGWGVYSTDLIRELMSVTTDEIRVRINSPGGDVFEGLAIHNALSIHPANIQTYVEGHAASAANFVALAGKKRTYAKYAMGMAHNPSSGIFGEAKDLRKMADLLDKVRDQLVKLYSDATGMDPAEWEEILSEETWFNAEEAVEFGLATDIDDTNNDKPTNTWNLGRVYNYGSRSEAPAPRRRPDIAAATRSPAPVQPTPDPVPNPVADEPEPGTSVDESGPGAFTFDPAVFTAAMSFAANPPVPTDQAPFEFDPDIFRAIMQDRTRTAPAVAVEPTPPEPPKFDAVYDPALMRQAVLEGISK